MDNNGSATSFVSIGDQLANIFTKSLFKPRLEELRDKLGLCDGYVLAQGGVLV